MAAINVGDSGDQAALTYDLMQPVDAICCRAQRFFDEQMQAALGELRGDRDVQVCRDRYDRDCRLSGKCLIEARKTLHTVSLGDCLTQRGVDLDEHHFGSTGGQEASQMPLADRADADNK